MCANCTSCATILAEMFGILHNKNVSSSRHVLRRLTRQTHCRSSLISNHRDYWASSLLACKHMYCSSLAQLRVTDHGAAVDKRVGSFWMVAVHLPAFNTLTPQLGEQRKQQLLLLAIAAIATNKGNNTTIATNECRNACAFLTSYRLFCSTMPVLRASSRVPNKLCKLCISAREACNTLLCGQDVQKCFSAGYAL